MSGFNEFPRRLEFERPATPLPNFVNHIDFVGEELTAEQIAALDPPPTLEEEAEFQAELERIDEAYRQGARDLGLF